MNCRYNIPCLILVCFIVPFVVYCDDIQIETIIVEGEINQLTSPAPISITRAPVDNRASNVEDPCNYKLLEKPDFRAPGRRISEEKCYEYIWNVKFREDKATKEAECEKSKLATSTTEKFNIFDPPPPAVIGGRTAIPGEFPNVAAIGWKTPDDSWAFKCGGTLISSNFVITAAHCSKASERDPSIADPVPKIVRMGIINLDGKRVFLLQSDYTITRVIVHPKYAAPKKYFDLALLELEKAVPFSVHMQPACLWIHSNTSLLGSVATVAGWGVVNTGTPLSSPELQTADIDIIDSKRCDELLRPKCNRLWCGVNDTQICAGKLSGGVDTCWGDSGGPLQVRIPLPITTQGSMYYLIGVTSFGFGCAMENTPGVYTRVSSFINWIESIVWK